jgi:mRNA interferase HigB
MHVIKKKTLDAYAAQYPDAAEPLRSWRKLMERQDFRDLVAMRAVWPTADFADPYTIFNIKGNHYRLLTIVHYRYKRVYIKAFLTHAAYDRWTTAHRQGQTS